jgi:hypothetical protein
LSSAFAELFDEMTAEPLDEIRGHLTGNLVRAWIRDHAIGLDATACMLQYNYDSRTVTAALVGEDSTPLYSPRGQRVVVVFAARSMDHEMQDVFSTTSTVKLTLKSAGGNEQC